MLLNNFGVPVDQFVLVDSCTDAMDVYIRGSGHIPMVLLAIHHLQRRALAECIISLGHHAKQAADGNSRVQIVPIFTENQYLPDGGVLATLRHLLIRIAELEANGIVSRDLYCVNLKKNSLAYRLIMVTKQINKPSLNQVNIAVVNYWNGIPIK